MLLWTREFGTALNETAYDVAVGAGGSVVVVGATEGRLSDQTPMGGTDAFVRAYDTDGAEQWTRQFGSPADDAAYGITTDDSRNAYVVGRTRGTLPGQITEGDDDAFVRKYHGDGTEAWTRQFGSLSAVAFDDVAVDSVGSL